MYFVDCACLLCGVIIMCVCVCVCVCTLCMCNVRWISISVTLSNRAVNAIQFLCAVNFLN